MNKKTLILSILLFAAFLRLVNLSGNRPHLTNDEAALGYNAYSILKTARDEHGTLLPVVFKSFGDWKPGLYIYATVPFVAIFGLNEFATRLPSAISGLFAIYILYLLVARFTKSKGLALLSAFFLSVSPWHITFSRGAWEANLALTITIAAVYFLLKYLSENTSAWNLYISAVLFALSLWAYQSAKLMSVLLLLLVVIVYKKQFFQKSYKKILTAGLIGFLLSIPIILSVLSGQSGRINVMSVFSSPRSEEYIHETITSHGDKKDSLEFTLFHSESFNFFRGIVSRYMNHFSGKFLLFEGDWANPRHTSPDVGYLLLIDFPLLILGLVFAIRWGKRNRFYWFMLAWLFVSPEVSSLSRDSVHGVRSLNMVVPLSFLLAVGAKKILFEINRWKFGFLLLFLFSAFYIYNFAYFLDAYFIHAPFSDSEHFMYGYKQIVERVTPVQSDYDKIVINKNFDQAYIFFLFYQKYDPALYQTYDNYEPTNPHDVGVVTKLDNISFRPINWSADKAKSGLMLIGREVKFPMYEVENSNDYQFERIKYLNGSPGFLILKIK